MKYVKNQSLNCGLGIKLEIYASDRDNQINKKKIHILHEFGLVLTQMLDFVFLSKVFGRKKIQLIHCNLRHPETADANRQFI